MSFKNFLSPSHFFDFQGGQRNFQDGCQSYQILQLLTNYLTEIRLDEPNDTDRISKPIFGQTMIFLTNAIDLTRFKFFVPIKIVFTFMILWQFHLNMDMSLLLNIIKENLYVNCTYCKCIIVYRRPRGRLAFVANSVFLYKHCINKINKNKINIDCWYAEAVLKSTRNLCFGSKTRKKCILL